MAILKGKMVEGVCDVDPNELVLSFGGSYGNRNLLWGIAYADK